MDYNELDLYLYEPKTFEEAENILNYLCTVDADPFLYDRFNNIRMELNLEEAVDDQRLDEIQLDHKGIVFNESSYDVEGNLVEQYFTKLPVNLGIDSAAELIALSVLEKVGSKELASYINAMLDLTYHDKGRDIKLYLKHSFKAKAGDGDIELINHFTKVFCGINERMNILDLTHLVNDITKGRFKFVIVDYRE